MMVKGWSVRMDKDKKELENEHRLEPGKYEESIAFEIKKQILDELDIKLDDLIEEAINRKDNKVVYKKIYEYDPNLNYHVKNKLREFIKKSPYSQTEIASMIGIAGQTLSNIVNNKFNTSLEVALKIACILKVPCETLFYLEVEND
jgi:putative transcriptional regulator